MRARYLIPVTVLVAIIGLAATDSRADPTLPIRFNAGSEEAYVAYNGDLYLPDQPWTPDSPAGYVGGYQQLPAMWWIPVGGTSDEMLYKPQRRDWGEYRISNIPNGDYLVTLRFSEQQVHGPGLSVFDVAIEGQTVLEDYDVFAQVGLDYASDRRFAVEVLDGELNVTAGPVVGEPHLAAVAVEARTPDLIAPATPFGLTCRGSYGAVLLDWAGNGEDDLDGYHVYRAEGSGGPYTRLTIGQAAHWSRYQDASAAPATTLYYRVSALDVYGNESALSAFESCAALHPQAATLPLYYLDLPPDNLALLYADPWADELVTGTFAYEGQAYPVEVRFRGGSGRRYAKKSWKVMFPADSPFPRQDRINLSADWMDRSLMRGKLAFDLFEAAGIRPPEAEHALLILNDDYLGVYSRYEQVDKGFLERTGRDPDVSVYKAIHSFTSLLPDEEAYRSAYDKETNKDLGYDDLVAFSELLHRTSDETFAYELARVFDVAAYLDYYAVIVLTSNNDCTVHNVYLLHDLSTDRWELVPWDQDNTFIKLDLPIDMGTYNSPDVIGGPNVLRSRVLDVPQFRAYYCQRLGQFMNTIYADANMHAQIEATYSTIEQDGLRDWLKLGWEATDLLSAAPDELKSFVTQRKSFLQGQMATYCPTETTYLMINEFMADNEKTLRDPTDGDYEDWFEIYNAGLVDVNLQGYYLTDDLAEPTKFQVTQPITIPALGFALFWADSEPGQGVSHVNFKLGAGGEAIAIFDADGTTLVDGHIFGAQFVDRSEGRYPDGVDNWQPFYTPTPGSSNLLRGPLLSDVGHTPLWPTAADATTVTALITDDGTVLTTTLHYSVDGVGFVDLPMVEQVGSQYAAQIPPQTDGSLVHYYIEATDDDGQTSASPPSAPERLHGFLVGYEPPPLYVNEFMADNVTTLEDPQEPGEYPAWIELYNPGPGAMDVGGMYLTDDLGDPTKFRISDGLTIPQGGFLLFYADDDPKQGVLHTTFKLDAGGESIGLFDRDATANQPIDTYDFGSQAADVSHGRCPDGGDAWVSFPAATPGAANAPCGVPPVISSAGHAPLWPAATESVTVTATITDDQAVASATLWYRAGGGYATVPMSPQGGDVYAATIQPQPDGTWVAYYVWAQDDEGFAATDPPDAPAETYGYRTGYYAPAVVLNEFMADNGTKIEDPDQPGEYPDWIELYNPGPEPADLRGLYLTTDLANPTQFRITYPITVPAGGHVLFWADDDPEQGPFHTNFKLSKSGEEIGLYSSGGTVQLDAVIFGPQTVDVGFGRLPDGVGAWTYLPCPTPGWPNTECKLIHLPLMARGSPQE